MLAAMLVLMAEVLEEEEEGFRERSRDRGVSDPSRTAERHPVRGMRQWLLRETKGSAIGHAQAGRFSIAFSDPDVAEAFRRAWLSQ